MFGAHIGDVDMGFGKPEGGPAAGGATLDRTSTLEAAREELKSAEQAETAMKKEQAAQAGREAQSAAQAAQAHFAKKHGATARPSYSNERQPAGSDVPAAAAADDDGDEADSGGWRAGDAVEVFSESKQKWMAGKIARISGSTGDMTVEYGTRTRKVHPDESGLEEYFRRLEPSPAPAPKSPTSAAAAMAAEAVASRVSLGEVPGETAAEIEAALGNGQAWEKELIEKLGPVVKLGYLLKRAGGKVDDAEAAAAAKLQGTQRRDDLDVFDVDLAPEQPPEGGAGGDTGGGGPAAPKTRTRRGSIGRLLRGRRASLGDITRKWDRRYFAMTAKCLLYFKTQADFEALLTKGAMPRGAIPLEGAKVLSAVAVSLEDEDDGDGGGSEELQWVLKASLTSEGPRHFEMAAESTKEMSEWREVLEAAIAGLEAGAPLTLEAIAEMERQKMAKKWAGGVGAMAAAVGGSLVLEPNDEEEDEADDMASPMAAMGASKKKAPKAGGAGGGGRRAARRLTSDYGGDYADSPLARAAMECVDSDQEDNNNDDAVDLSAEAEAVVRELVETEGQYVERLRMLAEEFYAPLKAKGVLDDGGLRTIFGPVHALLELHQHLLANLKAVWDQWGTAAAAAAPAPGPAAPGGQQAAGGLPAAFEPSLPFFRMYKDYAVGQAAAASALQAAAETNSGFKRFLSEAQVVSGRLRLQLITPIDRLAVRS
eukprot:SAG22_NODE_137_length_18056_cov_9.974940_3_plen_710_part_00